MIYIVRVASGHDWLVSAVSANDALDNWPGDAEEAIDAVEATPEEALDLQIAGDSDVSDDNIVELAVSVSEWRFSFAPTPSDPLAIGGELTTPSGDVIAACLWADGSLDIDSDGCGVMGDWGEIAGADDIPWPDEDEAMAGVS